MLPKKERGKKAAEESASLSLSPLSFFPRGNVLLFLEGRGGGSEREDSTTISRKPFSREDGRKYRVSPGLGHSAKETRQGCASG